MANSPGSLSLAALDIRLSDALADATVDIANRTIYMQDAYSRIWYDHPWPFTRAVATFSASAGQTDYVMDDQVSEVAALFNYSQQQMISMNQNTFMYFDNYRDNNHTGPLYTAIDLREDGGKTHIIFSEVPSAVNGMGHGDIIHCYYCKHIIHNTSAGTTATGNMMDNTDLPSFAPQFHALIVKEALIEAIKNRRDFQEMYQLAVAERDALMKSMKRHYASRFGSRTMAVYR